MDAKSAGVERELTAFLTASGTVDERLPKCKNLILLVAGRVEELSGPRYEGGQTTQNWTWRLLSHAVRTKTDLAETFTKNNAGSIQVHALRAAAYLLPLDELVPTGSNSGIRLKLRDKGKKPASDVLLRIEMLEAVQGVGEFNSHRKTASLLAGGFEGGHYSSMNDTKIGFVAAAVWRELQAVLASEDIVHAVLVDEDEDESQELNRVAEVLLSEPSAQEQVHDALDESGRSDESLLDVLGSSGTTAIDSREPEDEEEPAGTTESTSAAVLTPRFRQVKKLAVLASVSLLVLVLIGGVLLLLQKPNTPLADASSSKTATATPVSSPAAGAAVWQAGWGPVRPMYTVKSGGSTYPSFNSISDNPNIGDERNFVGLKRADPGSPNRWEKDVWGKPGDSYWMRVYVNNSGVDAFGTVMAGWIQGAKLQVGIYKADSGATVYGQLSAVNASTVWDGATIHVAPGTTVRFDETDVRLNNNTHSGAGLSLPAKDLLGDGVLLGYDKMDGDIQPGYQFASYVVLKVIVE